MIDEMLRGKKGEMSTIQYLKSAFCVLVTTDYAARSECRQLNSREEVGSPSLALANPSPSLDWNFEELLAAQHRQMAD